MNVLLGQADGFEGLASRSAAFEKAPANDLAVAKGERMTVIPDHIRSAASAGCTDLHVVHNVPAYFAIVAAGPAVVLPLLNPGTPELAQPFTRGRPRTRAYQGPRCRFRRSGRIGPARKPGHRQVPEKWNSCLLRAWPESPERHRLLGDLHMRGERSPRSPATSPAQYPAGSGVGVSVLLRQPHRFECFESGARNSC